MSVSYNGTNLTVLKYGSTELDKVVYNTTTVYQRITVNYYCENSIYRSVKVISGNNVDLSSSNAASKSGWSFVGWRKDKTASGSVESSITAGTVDINLYAVYRQTITLTYNGNGATSGSTASQTGYRYYNNGNIINPRFTVRSNGFSRTNYKFVNWRLNSTSGTAYNAGASITLSSNSTMYASWEASWVTSTVKYDGSGWRVPGDGNLMFGSTSSAENYADVVTTRTCTGNIVKFTDSSRYFRITANVNCTVSISYNVTIKVLDGWTWYSYRNNYAINGGSMVKVFDWGNYGGNGQQPSNNNPHATISVNLNAGQTLAFYASGGAGTSDRSWFRWIYTLTCTKR